MREQEKKQTLRRFENRLRRSLSRMRLMRQGVLAAISGGADSLALLNALARVGPRLGMRIEVASVNHGLRSDSCAEVERVAQHAKTRGLRFHGVSLALDVTQKGLEATARFARYVALERVRKITKLDAVATAHTASDQAETLLMRLARGTALGGAQSIVEARGDRVIRPLLFATRLDVEAYLEAANLVPEDDPMNADPTFLRTRIRHHVLPSYMRALGFDVQRALTRFAQLAAEDDAFLQKKAHRALKRCACPDGALDRLAAAALPRPILRRALVLWLSRAGLPPDAEMIEETVKAVKRAGTATLPFDRLLTCTDNRVQLLQAPPRQRSMKQHG